MPPWWKVAAVPPFLEENELLSRKSSHCMWPIPTPPPQKPPIPNLAANSSWVLFPPHYFQEVLVNMRWGINKPQKKTSWGSSVDAFSERPRLVHASIMLPGGEMALCSSFSSSWAPGWVFEEGLQMNKN